MDRGKSREQKGEGTIIAQVKMRLNMAREERVEGQEGDVGEAVRREAGGNMQVLSLVLMPRGMSQIRRLEDENNKRGLEDETEGKKYKYERRNESDKELFFDHNTEREEDQRGKQSRRKYSRQDRTRKIREWGKTQILTQDQEDEARQARHQECHAE